MSVKDINNTGKLLKIMQELYKKDIDVGILPDAGQDNLDKGMWNEYGTDTIPERSFIRAGYDENRKYIEGEAEKLVAKVVDQTINPNEAANVLGAVAKGKIQEFAIDLRSPPNAAMTIAKKGSSNPLVDTGEMIRSIDYKVNG